MKEVYLCQKFNFLSIRLLGIVLILCAIAFGGYGQAKIDRVKIMQVYDDEIEHWLFPANSKGTPPSFLAAFMVHPFPEPADYSVCLRDSARKFFLELRQLDKNLWIELFTRFNQKQSLDLPLKVSVYSKSVSRRFEKEMVSAFDKMSPYKTPHESVNYDGTTYDFRWVINGEMKKIHVSYGLKAESYYAGFINLMTQISDDLKNNAFKESNYIDKLK